MDFNLIEISTRMTSVWLPYIFYAMFQASIATIRNILMAKLPFHRHDSMHDFPNYVCTSKYKILILLFPSNRIFDFWPTTLELTKCAQTIRMIYITVNLVIKLIYLITSTYTASALYIQESTNCSPSTVAATIISKNRIKQNAAHTFAEYNTFLNIEIPISANLLNYYWNVCTNIFGSRISNRAVIFWIERVVLISNTQWYKHIFSRRWQCRESHMLRCPCDLFNTPSPPKTTHQLD